MGYFASSYQLFRTLLDPQKDTYLTSNAKQILKSFSLFGFIIYDPVKDGEFSVFINNRFDYFDVNTGPDFLFFCLIKDMKRQHRFELFTRKDSWRSNKAAEPVKDISLSTQALCTYLNIEYDKTPCLCLTTEFSYNSLIVLDTNIDKLDIQMRELTTASKYFNENAIRNNTYLKKIIETLATKHHNCFEFTEIQFHEGSLAQKLDIFLSAIKSNDNTFVAHEAKNVLDSWYLKELKSIKDNPDENKWLGLTSIASLSEADHSQSKFEGKTVFSMEEPSSTYYEQPIGSLRALRNIQGIEIQTRNFLKSAWLYERFLRSRPEFAAINEYSGYAITICKAYETEINLSIVQWIRKYLGIEMPIFFNLLKPGNDKYSYQIDTTIFSEPRPIFFNKGTRGKWLPPGLGESAFTFKSILFRNPYSFEYFKDSEDTLLELWIELNKIRQQVAHAEPVSIEEKRKLDDINRRFYSTGTMQNLVSLKEILRGS